MGEEMLLVGGGSLIKWEPATYSEIFCKWVYTYPERSIGNHKNKIWIESDQGESMVRMKSLQPGYREAFLVLEERLSKGCPKGSGIKQMLQYMCDNHAEELI